jgi:hypothetical protein
MATASPDAIGASSLLVDWLNPIIKSDVTSDIYVKKSNSSKRRVSTEIYPPLPTKRPVRVSKIIIKGPLCLTSADVASGIISKVDNLSSRRGVDNDVAL